MEAKTAGADVSGRNAPVAVHLNVPGTLNEHVERLASERDMEASGYFHSAVALTVLADLGERGATEGKADHVPGEALPEAALCEAVEGLVDMGMLDRLPGEPESFVLRWGSFNDGVGPKDTRHLDLECDRNVSSGRNRAVPVTIHLPGTLLAHVNRLAALRGKPRDEYILLAAGFAVEAHLPKPAGVRADMKLSDLSRDKANHAAKASIDWLIEIGRFDAHTDNPSLLAARW